jgi:uncharacterized protein (TIGR03382 family)
MRAVLAIIAVHATIASASPMTVSGVVTDARGRWTADGSRIVTDATVTTATGDVVVSQLGGTVDGVTMRTFPTLARPLELGMYVEVAAHDDYDLAQRRYVVVDDVHVVQDVGAFVRTGPTKAGRPLFWESGCIFVTLDSAGTTAVPFATTQQVVGAAIQTWNGDVASCSYIKVMADTPKAVEVGKDYVNVIKFRDELPACVTATADNCWCRPAVDGDPMRCYPAAAAGITTAIYIDDGGSRDGAIVDADIEINGVNFAISVNGQTASTQVCHAELQNTLTHELGHLHGLAHTCQTAVDPPNVDNHGNPVPLCTQTTDPMIINATMYPFQDCGETKKEALQPDDISAMCTVYPTASDPKSCKRVSPPGVGCGCAGGRGGGGTLVLGAAVVGLALRRKTRRALPAR